MDHPNLYSIEAEQAVIGGVILNNETWDIVSEILETSDFYKKEHQVLFDMIKFLISKDEPIDKITIMNLLQKSVALEKKNSIEYINSLVKNTPNIKNIESYANIVKNKSILRKIVEISKEIIDRSLTSKNDNINEILDFVDEKILTLSKKIDKSEEFIDIKNIIKRTVKKIEDLYETKSPLTGLSSGFVDLDKITSGFHKSDLIIVAGRPSMGKSTLAVNIAENTVINLQKPVIIFSMEMSTDQIIMRMMSSLSRINLQNLRSGTINTSDWPRLTSSISLLMDKNLYIDDSGALTPFEIKSKVRSIYKKYKSIGLVIIDYIQLIKIPDLQDNRTREIAEISRSFKILAKEIDAPVMVLSQLNRSLEQRNDKRPLISDLRESGAIEQDADLIIFIYRDEIYNKTNQNNQSEIIVAKQRNGPTGKINLKFFPEYCRFENIEKDEKSIL